MAQNTKPTWKTSTQETTRHLQSEKRSRHLGIRREDLGPICKDCSNGSFTAQVLIRTGRGNALGNTRATKRGMRLG
ncbi:MAG: hypothetical protein ISN28_12450 [Ectothiorhodospiraceae bacterium AqS1]|nr:hypothetical protein [Ectothiorhodospiraceae bacterium AqS1]